MRFELTRAYADGLQDRSNQPLWDICILGIKLIPGLRYKQRIFPTLILSLLPMLPPKTPMAPCTGFEPANLLQPTVFKTAPSPPGHTAWWKDLYLLKHLLLDGAGLPVTARADKQSPLKILSTLLLLFSTHRMMILALWFASVFWIY